MKINSVFSCSFGAKLNNNTKIIIENAKRKNIDTSKMEKLMEEVYPNETIYTDIYENSGKSGIISIGIGRKIMGMYQKETLFTNYNYDSYLGGEFGPMQKIDKEFIDNITKRLEEIKEKGV